jgi:hypothetical protein
MSEGKSQASEAVEQMWKVNDRKAQKNGSHRSVYWVEKKKQDEEGKVKGEKWVQSTRYIGEWRENARAGYGSYFYPDGNKYEGQWESNKRHGHGTLWHLTNVAGDKYRRVYTGDWEGDKMSGRGSYFYENEDRYDGLWFKGKRNGQGRMMYANGDIYEGEWVDDMRQGYGCYSKANGDYFEGYYYRDKKEGQGSYFFNTSSKLYVGEWVDDAPKAGVYSEVENPQVRKYIQPQYYTDPYELQSLPALKLANAQDVVRAAMEEARNERLAELEMAEEAELENEDLERVEEGV